MPPNAACLSQVNVCFYLLLLGWPAVLPTCIRAAVFFYRLGLPSKPLGFDVPDVPEGPAQLPCFSLHGKFGALKNN